MTSPKQYKVEAIVLNTRPLGEKDKLVSIMTRAKGRFTVVAKSAASPKSRLRGCIEPTTCSAFEMYRGKSLDMITEAQLLNGFWGIREDLDRLFLAGYFLKVVYKMTVEYQENEQLFDLLYTCLRDLDLKNAVPTTKAHFQTQVLILEGLWDKDCTVTDQEFKDHLYTYCEVPGPWHY